MPKLSLTSSLAAAAIASFAFATTAAANPDIDAAVVAVTPEILELRHHIHQNPELGNREFKTAELIAEHLTALGFDKVTTGVAHTGVVGVLVGGKPGPTVAVRADMDALPVTEATDYPFKSTVRTTYLGQEVGVMHACGHDVHVAVQLGLASMLAGMRAELPGTVKFIFQPAEEGPPPGEEGGAEMMVQEGVLEDPQPEAIFGLHTFASMPVGQLGYTVGPAFAAVDHFKVELRGQQSHGAAPHLGVDPMVMTAQAILGLQTIRSRTLSPLEPSVVSVGIVRGGTRFNIIPESVHLEGTVRTYTPEARDTVERRMHEILGGVAAASGGAYDLDYDRGTPPTVNDPKLSHKVAPSLAKAVAADQVSEIEPTMGGEDFAYFANAVPGFYFRLGVADPEKGSGGHHTPTFAADDASVPIGMRAMANVVLDYLHAANR